jgi:O-6-methylguanine DNA methyltransferase
MADFRLPNLNLLLLDVAVKRTATISMQFCVINKSSSSILANVSNQLSPISQLSDNNCSSELLCELLRENVLGSVILTLKGGVICGIIPVIADVSGLTAAELKIQYPELANFYLAHSADKMADLPKANANFTDKMADSPKANANANAKYNYGSINDNNESHMTICASGTPFRMKVWSEISKIPKGETRTYSEIAQLIGNPKATRAVAQACGANRLSIIVPCHRVVSKDPSHIGYHWGPEIKSKVLAYEKSKSI